MKTSSEKNTATFIHLSTLTKYFIPFGNYLFPILIWSSKKEESEFIDYNGKQVLNFQLSFLLYSIILFLIAAPIFIFTVFSSLSFNAIVNDTSLIINNLNIESNNAILTLGILCVIIFGILKIAEFFLIIYASIKTSNGEKYKYPLSIPFIK